MTAGKMDTFNMNDTSPDLPEAGQAALETINLLKFGMAIIGPQRRTLFINEAARSIIEHSEILELRSNIVRFSPTSLECWLAGQLREYRHYDSAKYIPDGGGQLVLSIHLLPDSASSPDNPLYCLSLNHLPGKSERMTDTFSVLFSLTSREAEVSGLLIGGYSSREIAGILGVMESTIRSHTKKIYHKTRVSRQTELIRLGMILCFQ